MLTFNEDTPPAMLTVVGPESSVEDQRGRFRQIVCAINDDHGRELPDYRPCENILWRLRDEPPGYAEPVHLGPPRLPLRVVFVGGLASECFANLFSLAPFTFRHVMRLGLSVKELPVPGFGSTSYNGRLIAQRILAMEMKEGEKLVLVGHSKGAADILEALVGSPPAARRVAAVVGIAGAINGSPLTETAPRQLLATLQQIPVDACRMGDGEAIDSLQRDRRLRWVAENRLPEHVRYYSLVSFTNRDDISLAMRGNYDRLSQLDPRNDGQLLYYDQVIPKGALLGYANADHWAVAMPINRIYPTLSQVFADRAAFPREVLLEAIIRHVEEDLMRNQKRMGSESPPHAPAPAPAS